MKKNFLISTGGSGGHVVPATILYEHLSEQANIIISCDKRGLKYLDKSNYKLEIINTPKLNNIFFHCLHARLIYLLTAKSEKLFLADFFFRGAAGSGRPFPNQGPEIAPPRAPLPFPGALLV